MRFYDTQSLFGCLLVSYSLIIFSTLLESCLRRISTNQAT